MTKFRNSYAVALVAGVIFGMFGFAAPSPAATTCSWDSGQWGNKSNCDNLPLSTCTDWSLVRTATIGPGIVVELYYNASCRTVAAGVRADVGDLFAENCYVKIHRNSDDEILYAGAALRSRNPNFFVGTTTMLYDADVTSYAWSHCALSNGAVYRGGTTSY